MPGRGLTLLLSAAVALGWAGPAPADEADVVRLYEESQSAWADGRTKEADRAGEAAWRAAEAEWGASPNTAVLAANLAGWRLLMGERESALAPAQRAAQLARDGIAPAVPLLEAELIESIAAFDPEAAGGTEIDALRDAAAHMQAEGGASPLVWLALLDVAGAEERRRRHGRAGEVASEALELMEAQEDPPGWALAQALAVIGREQAWRRHYGEAQAAFGRAATLVPQEDADGETSLVWARLVVWRDAMGASNDEQIEDAVPLDEYLEVLRDPVEVEGTDCTIQWLVMTPAIYPRSALYRGMVGAALLEYEISPEGRPTNVRSLAVFPEEGGFAEPSVKALENWLANPDMLDGCVGLEMQTGFTFAIK